MSVWFRDKTNRLTRMDPNPPQNMEGQEAGDMNPLPIQIPNEALVPQGRYMQDYLNPTRASTPSCIVLPANAHTFTIKPGMLPSLPTFHGMESESPYLHVKEFEEMVGTMVDGPRREDIARLKLFPFSLKDRAKIWLNSLRSNSIISWGSMQEEFFKKFFPMNKTASLKKLIYNFQEKEEESFYACWERYKDLLTAIPHHGYNTGRILSFFYEGISAQTRQFINMMCNGQFMRKSPEEALDFFDELAENNQSWDFSYSAENSRQALGSNTSGHGKYTLREPDDLQAKYTQLARKLEALEIKKVHEISTPNKIEDFCVICDRPGHSAAGCPTLPAFKEVLHGGDQISVNAMSQTQGQKPFNSAYSNTYNPGWRNHPNFSWRNADNSNLSQGGQTSNPPQQHASPMGLNPYGNQNQGQANFQQAQYQNHNQNVYQPPQKRSLEDTLHNFIQNQQASWVQNNQAISDIRIQLTNLTTAVGGMQLEKGKFPSQPLANPKGQSSIETSITSETQS